MLQILWNRIAYSGVFFSKSFSEQKYIVLINVLSIFVSFYTIINIILLLFFNTPNMILFGGIIFSISVLFTIFFNSIGKTLFSKLYFLFASYFYILFISLMQGNQAKSYFFLIPICLTAFFIFQLQEKKWMLVSVLITFTSFIILEILHSSLVPFYKIPEESLYSRNVMVDISFAILILVFSYYIMNTYNRTELFALIEQEKSERLLKNILPASVIQKLREKDDTIAERYENCTVLFADIVGFTELSRKMTAVEVVSLLNQIFSNFDDLVDKHGLEKIKTIGDAYMVAGGVPEIDLKHAEKIATLALEMLELINQFCFDKEIKLELRIGINSGDAVAGVIGKKKFIFDLWGNSVNLASRMESQGIPGKIQVTESTHSLLKDNFEFLRREKFDVKGIGSIHSYLLIGKLENYNP